MTAPRSALVRGALPWAGQRRPAPSGSRFEKDPVPEPPRPPAEEPWRKQRWHGPLAEAISRYPNPADRAAILGARLAQLRANPPAGYPR